MNADSSNLLAATPSALINKNLFSYCDNNSIIRIDRNGRFWETIFDVVSLGASIIEVSANPSDPLAWACLVGDTVDLLPFVTGVGEVTKSVKITVKTVNRSNDVLDIARDTYKLADISSDLKKSTGSYEILYKSGRNYIGKGGFKRAMVSANRNAVNHGDEIVSIFWKSAPNTRSAFIDEYLMQERFSQKIGLDNPFIKKYTYNKIWSPGRRYFNGH